MWSVYILNSLIKRKWNDFLYAICILWVSVISIPIWINVLLVFLLIFVHRFIDLKEKEQKEN